MYIESGVLFRPRLLVQGLVGQGEWVAILDHASIEPSIVDAEA